jgi:hypothetical protein
MESGFSICSRVEKAESGEALSQTLQAERDEGGSVHVVCASLRRVLRLPRSTSAKAFEMVELEGQINGSFQPTMLALKCNLKLRVPGTLPTAAPFSRPHHPSVQEDELMTTKPSSVSSSINPDDQFFRRSIFRSYPFSIATIVLAMGLFDGGIILARRRLDAGAVFGAVVMMLVSISFWIRILVIHRKTRKLTAGSRSPETALVLQILAQTLVFALLIISILMMLALSHVGNAPR